MEKTFLCLSPDKVCLENKICVRVRLGQLYHVSNSRSDQSHQEAGHGEIIFKILERQCEVTLDGAI